MFSAIKTLVLMMCMILGGVAATLSWNGNHIACFFIILVSIVAGHALLDLIYGQEYKRRKWNESKF